MTAIREWQPIETSSECPEGGFFLVWNGKEVLPAMRNHRGDFEDITSPDRDGEWLDVYPAPTHWMPLPEPPRDSDGSA